MPPRLEPLDFASLAGWGGDDHGAALGAFKRSALAIAAGQDSPRPAQSAPPGLAANGRAALCQDRGRTGRAAFFRGPLSTVPRHSRGWRRLSDRLLRTLHPGFDNRNRGVSLADPGAAGRSCDVWSQRRARRISRGRERRQAPRRRIARPLRGPGRDRDGGPRPDRLGSRCGRGLPRSGSGLGSSRVSRSPARPPRL